MRIKRKETELNNTTPKAGITITGNMIRLRAQCISEK